VLWVEACDGSLESTTGVVLDLDEAAGINFGSLDPHGGDEGDGVYVRSGEHAREGYPSGEKAFSFLVSEAG